MASMRPNNGGGFGGGFSHKAPLLATDMRCYFQCPEGFKRDYDLRLHIKLRHRNEDEATLRVAYQDAEDEIALVRRTYSVFECSLCPKTYNESGAFYDHIRKKHGMEWPDYRDRYGRCETESAPFECKICGKVLKYVRDSIHGHLKFVHKITWEIYIDRIRRMRRGEDPGELPSIDMFECKICSVTVKYMWRKDHLKRAHKITEPEYAELYKDQLVKTENVDKSLVNSQNNYGAGNQNYQPMQLMQTPNSVSNTFRNDQQSYSYSSNFNQNTGYQNNQNYNHYENEENSGYHNFPQTGYDNHRSYPSQSNENYHQNEVRSPPSNYFSRSIPNTDGRSTTNNNNLPKPPKSDIQDSRNKVCSSCNVKFETRRLFIEHCTTTHKMKFKTASGATISSTSAPQTMFSPQHQDMNRPFQDNRNIAPQREHNTHQTSLHYGSPYNYSENSLGYDSSNSYTSFDRQTYVNDELSSMERPSMGPPIDNECSNASNSNNSFEKEKLEYECNVNSPLKNDSIDHSSSNYNKEGQECKANDDTNREDSFVPAISDHMEPIESLEGTVSTEQEVTNIDQNALHAENVSPE